MAVDISAQLRAIANDEYGGIVLNNIGSAVETLNSNYSTDVSQELSVIYNGVYGRDIRRSIHDALFKLSIASPGTGGESVITGVPTVYINGVGVIVPIIDTIYGTAEEA